MSRHPDLFADLVEGQSYQVSTSPARPDKSGGIRWFLHRYQRPGPELAELAGLRDRDEPLWCQVATCTTVALAADYYRGFALNWLRELGHNPDAMDIGLFLMPHVIERLTPRATD